MCFFEKYIGGVRIFMNKKPYKLIPYLYCANFVIIGDVDNVSNINPDKDMT